MGEVLAVLAAAQAVRYGHHVDPAELAAPGRQGIEDEAVVQLGVDEGDLDAVLDEAVGELHHRDDMPLRGVRQHQDARCRRHVIRWEKNLRRGGRGSGLMSLQDQ